MGCRSDFKNQKTRWWRIVPDKAENVPI